MAAIRMSRARESGSRAASLALKASTSRMAQSAQTMPSTVGLNVRMDVWGLFDVALRVAWMRVWSRNLDSAIGT